MAAWMASASWPKAGVAKGPPMSAGRREPRKKIRKTLERTGEVMVVRPLEALKSE